MPERTDLEIRVATPTDHDAVVRVLSDAFADDPVFSWIYPDPATRYRALPGFFAILAAQSVRNRADLVVGDGWGAAVWAPPGKEIVDPGDGPSVGAAMVALSPADAERLGQSDELFSAHHPTEPHWYLSLIGVADAHRGKGIGSAVLRASVARCDDDGMPAYLEATKEDNRRLYERHGFVVTEEMRLPDGGPPVWAMWRDPGA